VGGSDNSFSSYFNEVLIEVNLLFRLVPSALETGGQRMWGDLGPAMSPALYGLCCAALRRRNTIF
jgi:hypothetical protein